jgi:hypothetical protein
VTTIAEKQANQQQNDYLKWRQTLDDDLPLHFELFLPFIVGPVTPVVDEESARTLRVFFGVRNDAYHFTW